MPTKIGHNSGRLWLTRSYNFIDKDPEIDVFRTMYQKQRVKESDLAVLAGLSLNTVKNMFGGQTRRPLHATFGKLAGAMGCEYGLKQIEKPDYEKEIPKARAQFKDYRATLAKRKARRSKKKTNGHG